MENKNIIQSLTVWGAILIGICTAVFRTMGKQAAADALQNSSTDFTALLTLAGQGIGLVMVIVGRFKAKTTLTVLPTAAPILILCVLLAGMTGCSQVQMSAPYTQQTEQAAIAVHQFDNLCQAGDCNACQMGLRRADKTLQLLTNALHGTVDANVAGGI